MDVLHGKLNMLEDQREADELLFFCRGNDEQHTQKTAQEKRHTEKYFGGHTKNPHFH